MPQADPAETPEENTPESEESQDGRPIAQFVHEHPAMTIAGGIALGVLVAAMLPKRNRKFVTEKSSALAEAVSTAGLILYREAVDRAGAAGDGIRDIAGRIGHAGGGRSKERDRSDADGNESQAGGFDLAQALGGIVRQMRGRSQDR